MTAAKRAEEIREPLLEKATLVWQRLLDESGDDVNKALNQADQLLATMALPPSQDVNVEQLRMVLRLLLAHGAPVARPNARSLQMLSARNGWGRVARPKG